MVLFTSHPAKEAARKQVGATVEETQRIYRALLTDIFSKVNEAQKFGDFDLIIASDRGDLPNLRKASTALSSPIRFQFFAHQHHSFDEKFKQALQNAFSNGYEQVMIIGNDIPDLTPELLHSAFQQLNTNDVVVGPATDGGFYLLGLTEFRHDFFNDIHWCGNGVFRQLLSNLHLHNLSIALLTYLGDIDSHAELKAWVCQQITQSTLLYLLLSALLRRCPICFYYTHPFLTRRHINRRIWQKPPPR